MNLEEFRKKFRTRNLIIPFIVGIVVAIYLIYNEFDPTYFSKINWTFYTTFYLIMSIIMMLLRDIAYMLRLRVLTGKDMTWKGIFNSIMLWEFASSITPSVVGGSTIAMFILNQEKLTLGRSTAVVLITSLLDELFFIIMVPILFISFPTEKLFISGNYFSFSNEVRWIFIISYSLILLYCILIYLAIFWFPNVFSNLTHTIFKIKFLKKWKHKADFFSEEIFIASQEFKGKSLLFWVKAFGTTFLSWTSRYWVVNFLILASLVSVNEKLLSVSDHLLIYSRQLIMWIFMLISPTPGASGIAEIVFSNYLSDFTPKGLANSLGFIWRLISYYSYIISGLIVLNFWINNKIKNINNGSKN